LKAVVLSPEPDVAGTLSPSVSRFADYVALTKPRIALLVLFTVAAGALFAGGRATDPVVVFHAVFGTALVAGGASALNQLIEKDSDARMRRTAGRPLPAGRLQPLEVLLFGSGLAAAGLLYLTLTLNSPAAALVAAVTFACYVGVYTPLKARTPLNTLVGAVPGALPPVIGWAAVRGSVDNQALALFVILFLWQVPHFLAIAWMYRDEYARAGLCMLPSVDPEGTETSRHMITWCLTLIPASLGPVLLGAAGPVYFVGAVVLGLGFLAPALAFGRTRSLARARRVVRASLLYLPGLFALLLLDAALPWLTR
jgi:protoheme IX farnesyltransferase